MQICHICSLKTGSFRAVTGLPFMASGRSAFHDQKVRNVCRLFIDMYQKRTIIPGLGKSSGLLSTNIHKPPCLRKRKRSQLAEEEVAFKHAQSTSRAFGFITVQYGNMYLLISPPPSQQIPYVLGNKQQQQACYTQSGELTDKRFSLRM